MKENVALEKKKQKSFDKSVNKYKTLLKKGDIKIKEKPIKRKPKEKKKRGVVYLGNIPHGFYEKQLRGYFRQFGPVTRVRLARSEKTGKSKGHAFIEFVDLEVAKIAAETMNNYLMGKRLLKTQYISPEEQKTKDVFKGKNFTATWYPTLINRKKHVKVHNSKVPDEKVLKKSMQAINRIKKVQKTLKDMGIDYDFMPVDIPPSLEHTFTPKLNESTISSSSISESEDNDEDIVFTPPEDLVKLFKQKLEQSLQKTNSTKKLSKKANKTKEVNNSKKANEEEEGANINSKKSKKLKATNGWTITSTSDNLDDSLDNKSKKIDKKSNKSKLIGISKKTKETKSMKLNKEKGNLILNQINNKDQISIKSPKSLKSNKTSSKQKTLSKNKKK